MSRFISDNDIQIIDLGNNEWIKIPSKLSYKLIASFAQTDGNDIEKTGKLLQQIIKEWNLTDGDGLIPDITIENIEKLDYETVTLIVNAITPLMTLDKKKLIS